MRRILCLIAGEYVDRRSGNPITFIPTIVAALDGSGGRQFCGTAEVEDDVAEEFFTHHPNFADMDVEDEDGEQLAKVPALRARAEQNEAPEHLTSKPVGEAALVPDEPSQAPPRKTTKKTFKRTRR